MNHEIMAAAGAILIVLLVLALSAVGADHWLIVAGLALGTPFRAVLAAVAKWVGL